MDHKYGKPRQEHEWVKVHLMYGVKNNAVTAVEILGTDAQDCPILQGLLNSTAQNFTVKEVSGDKAYGSFKNYDAIEAVGETPFIPLKTHQGFSGKHKLWGQMFRHFCFRLGEFGQHYYKRSNVESTFKLIKVKFRDHVRSKTDVARWNEALCKILCHNICVLI